jgi:hypothetical protein
MADLAARRELPNFALSAWPSSVPVQAGSSSTTTITHTPLNGIDVGPGPVSLSVSGCPPA